jgi:UDP-N-acetylmuramate dehydrogenase
LLDSNTVRRLEQAAGKPASVNIAASELLSIGCGGRAACLLDAVDAGKLAELLAVLEQEGVSWQVIGRGTNLLISDAGFDGVLIRLTDELQEFEAKDSAILCGGGASLPRVANLALSEHLTGLEPLAQIPGSIGGAVVMNAGSFGSTIGGLLSEAVVCWPGRCETMGAADLEFGYRSSSIPTEAVVAQATLTLHPAEPAQIKKAMIDFGSRRKQTQPLGKKTFGSAFRNPSDSESAGSLLDRAGCKELSAGGAAISGKHANFIINRGNATTADVINLMNACRQRVMDGFGVVLQPEVRFLGDITLAAV